MPINFDIETKDIYGQSLLALAIEARSYLVVEKLLSCRANIWSKDMNGGTPLTIAAAYKDAEFLDLLAKYKYIESAKVGYHRIRPEYWVLSPKGEFAPTHHHDK